MITFLPGDILETLPTVAAGKFLACITSPPYYGLRNYGTARWDGGDPKCEHVGSERYYTENSAGGASGESFSIAGSTNAARIKAARWREVGTCTKCGAKYSDPQIGLERTPQEYVDKMVAVFREVRRTLADDGTLWLNLGDCYARNGGAAGGGNRELMHLEGVQTRMGKIPSGSGLKEKDLIGIPWRVAFALQADGWYLRSAIPWIKRNCMPESVTDRPTSAIEYVFLMSKTDDYHYDADAIAMQATSSTEARLAQDIENQVGTERANGGAKTNGNFKSVCGKKHTARLEGEKGETNHGSEIPTGLTRNRRNSDWFFESWQGLYSEDEQPLALVVNPKPFREAHFATWPEKLVEPMILAGTKPGDEVLDPFGGSGTTGKVALGLGRRATLCELNPEYLKIARQRCETTIGLGI